MAKISIDKSIVSWYNIHNYRFIKSHPNIINYRNYVLRGGKLNKNIFQRGWVVLILALLCTALWGSATPFIKLGYQHLEVDTTHIPSIFVFAGVRFFFAGLLTIVIYSIARKRVLYPRRENIAKVSLVSLFQTVLQYVLFYIGLANTSGVKGTICSATNTFFAILVASIIFRQEKLTLKKVLAMVIGFMGVVVVNLNGLELGFNIGDACVILSALMYGVSNVLIKKYSADEDPVVISGYQFLMGGAFMTILGLVLGGEISLVSIEGAGIMLYLSALSAIAYSVWGVLLKYNHVSKVTIYCFMIPVFGVVLSMLMLTESSGVDLVNMLIALLLICIGVLILNLSPKSRQIDKT